MTVPSDASSGGSSGNWLFKNKEHGKMSAAASLVCRPFNTVFVCYDINYLVRFSLTFIVPGYDFTMGC